MLCLVMLRSLLQELLALMQATIIKADEALPSITFNDANELQAIIACESDIRLLNISEAIKAELIATLDYSEIHIFAELIGV